MERHRAVGSWFSLSARMSELGAVATWLPERTSPPNLGLRGARLTFLRCLQYVFAPFCSLSEPRKNKNSTWPKRGVAVEGQRIYMAFFLFAEQIQPLSANCIGTRDWPPFFRLSSHDKMVFGCKLEGQ